MENPSSKEGLFSQEKSNLILVDNGKMWILLLLGAFIIYLLIWKKENLLLPPSKFHVSKIYIANVSYTHSNSYFAMLIGPNMPYITNPTDVILDISQVYTPIPTKIMELLQKYINGKPLEATPIFPSAFASAIYVALPEEFAPYTTSVIDIAGTLSIPRGVVACARPRFDNAVNGM